MGLYKDKKVLIIDDFPEFRMSLRQMLLSIKVEDIHMASTGEEALRMCQKNIFDVVLCDYNLGDGKDGQQLLEELREYKLLNHSAIFMMLTAESTAFMVMGAMENSPDAYLTKPFTRQDLAARLDRLIIFKEEMEPINDALNIDDQEEALQACKRLILARSKVSSQALRMQSAILMRMKRFDEAEKIFTAVIKARSVPWGHLGLARCFFLRQEFDLAQIEAEKVLKLNDNFLDGHDLLAEIFLAKGDSKSAQKILAKAIAKSSKSPKRQHRLGEVAKQNNDMETATRALRRTVELSQHGLHQNPNNVLDWVEVLRDKAASDSSLSGKRAASDALGALDKYKKEIRKDPNTNVLSKVLESKIYHTQHKEKEAIKAAKDAKKLHETLGDDVGPQVLVELAETMLDISEFEDAAILLAQLDSADLAGVDNPEKLKKSIEAMLKNPELAEFHNALNPDNQKGIEYYDQGLYEEALESFRIAVVATDNSISVNLNLAQNLIKMMQLQSKVDRDLLSESSGCFIRIGAVEPDNPRFKRYAELQRLQQSYEAKLAAEKK